MYPIMRVCGYWVFSTTKKKRKRFCTKAKTAKADKIVYCAFQPLRLFEQIFISISKFKLSALGNQTHSLRISYLYLFGILLCPVIESLTSVPLVQFT